MYEQKENLKIKLNHFLLINKRLNHLNDSIYSTLMHYIIHIACTLIMGKQPEALIPYNNFKKSKVVFKITSPLVTK